MNGGCSENPIIYIQGKYAGLKNWHRKKELLRILLIECIQNIRKHPERMAIFNCIQDLSTFF